MRIPRVRSIIVFVAVVALIAGISLLVYARWSAPLAAAATATDAGDSERALAAYRLSIARFNDMPLTQQLFPPDYARATHNQLALLYRAGNYDAVIEAAETAPPAASPYFWAGCALFAKSEQEEKAAARLEWINRAKDTFKLALAAAPEDWDTKYNYELASRLAAALKTNPKQAPPALMQLLRPSKEGPTREPVKKTG
jgi:tetratricopeptide (TPR) repeat protein